MLQASLEASHAESSVHELGNEVQRLEAEVAKTNPAANQNSIEKLADSLHQVISEMKASQYIPEDLIKNAQSSMSKLYEDVRAVSDLAAKTAQDQSKGKGEGKVRKMARSASDPSMSPSKVEIPAGKAMRIIGRQSADELRDKGNLLHTFAGVAGAVPGGASSVIGAEVVAAAVPRPAPVA